MKNGTKWYFPPEQRCFLPEPRNTTCTFYSIWLQYMMSINSLSSLIQCTGILELFTLANHCTCSRRLRVNLKLKMINAVFKVLEWIQQRWTSIDFLISKTDLDINCCEFRYTTCLYPKTRVYSYFGVPFQFLTTMMWSRCWEPEYLDRLQYSSLSFHKS